MKIFNKIRKGMHDKKELKKKEQRMSKWLEQKDHEILWKWFKNFVDYWEIRDCDLMLVKRAYYAGFINLRNIQYLREKIKQRNGWECPNCGIIDNKNVTFTEHCALCGRYVGV